MPEFAGFVVDHILIPMINEAIGIYAENDVPVDRIDEAMRLGACLLYTSVHGSLCADKGTLWLQNEQCDDDRYHGERRTLGCLQ